jgi:hypothetical protein
LLQWTLADAYQFGVGKFLSNLREGGHEIHHPFERCQPSNKKNEADSRIDAQLSPARGSIALKENGTIAPVADRSYVRRRRAKRDSGCSQSLTHREHTVRLRYSLFR